MFPGAVIETGGPGRLKREVALGGNLPPDSPSPTRVNERLPTADFSVPILKLDRSMSNLLGNRQAGISGEARHMSFTIPPACRNRPASSCTL